MGHDLRIPARLVRAGCGRVRRGLGPTGGVAAQWVLQEELQLQLIKPICERLTTGSCSLGGLPHRRVHFRFVPLACRPVLACEFPVLLLASRLSSGMLLSSLGQFVILALQAEKGS